jgi:hypothetical protein
MRLDFDHASAPAKEPRGDKKPFDKNKPRNDAPRDANKDAAPREERKESNNETPREVVAPKAHKEEQGSSARRKKNDRPAERSNDSGVVSERKYFS